MRRSLLALSAAVLALSLTGCGDDGSDDAGDPAASETTSSLVAPTDVPTDAASTTPTDEGSEPADPAAPSGDPEGSEAPEATETEPEADDDGGTAELARTWEQLLDDIVDTSTPPQQRARLIEGSSPQVVELIAQVDSRMAGYDLRFHAKRPQSMDGTWSSDVEVSNGDEELATVVNVEFVQRSGGWLLSQVGACGLAAVAGVRCGL